MNGAEVRLAAVDVAFDEAVVLRGADLTVAASEIVGLLGPSGSGKSTLLRVVAGIVVPDGGSVHIGGVDVTDLAVHRRGVGMVFQDDQLFPHRSTLDNVAFGLKMARVDRATRHAAAAAWLERVGLGGFGARAVTELSGGEAKRVALARTLITEPSVVLLDEPLTGLDRELHDHLMDELAGLLRDTGATAIIVTHDIAEADAIADRTVTMDELQRPPMTPSTTSTPMEPVEITAADTHDLRRRVLRDGDESADVRWSGDDDPTTFHLGVRDDSGAIIAVSTWMTTPAGTQLRGMATDPERMGQGVGSRLLAAGVDRCRQRGDERVWANARVSALAFYERAGFVVSGDVFATPDTGLPHRRVDFPF